MPNTLLTPTDAARLAQMIYGGLTQNDPAQIIARYGNGIGNLFSPAGGTISGRTGVLIGHRNSNFAMVLDGRGRYAGQKVVTIRGTQMESGRDWLSNINVAIDSGPGGHVVHAGFHRVYRSIVDGVRSGIGTGSPSMVHVIGHSLGGAIASNLALDLSRGVHTVAMYTFGAPRAGMVGHARDLSTRLGSRLKRVYNVSDPVPMVPLFPFLHTPYPGDGLRVGSSGNSISASHHDIGRYITHVDGKTWPSLARASRRTDTHVENIEEALDMASRYSTIPGGSMAFWALSKSLGLILDLVGGSVMLAASAAATALDMVASLLTRAAQIASRAGEWILGWVRSAMRWLGREVATTATEITQAFLRYVLNLIFSRVSSLARRAIDVLPG